MSCEPITRQKSWEIIEAMNGWVVIPPYHQDMYRDVAMSWVFETPEGLAEFLKKWAKDKPGA